MIPSEVHCSPIVIVGGGCSGLLVAVQLFRNGFRGRVSVIEPRERLGAGLAYSTSFDQHLLNVPAGRMSALAAQPAHFLEWLRAQHGPEASADSFAPRKLYGEYLRDLLRQTIRDNAGSCVDHIRAEAVRAQADASGAHLELSNGQTIHAQRVVLALGNPASCPAPGLARQGLEDRWHLSPWFGDALRVRFTGERILLVGTGLTAVDSALALQSQEAACKVYMLSSRGVLPQVHDLRVRAGTPPLSPSQGNLRTLLRELRDHIEMASREAIGWRAVIDSLRPVSNEIWRELPLSDRQRFLRHLKRYWEPHRHRMAPEIRARLDGYRAEGCLEIIAGRFQDVCPRGRDTQVRILLKQGAERILDVDRIISCTGIHEDYTDSPRPLIRSLLKNGLARANDLGIGFRTGPHGELLDQQMRPSSVFFTLGPPRRGELFETTAVPEIRVQAAALALHLAAGEPVDAIVTTPYTPCM